MLLYPLNTILQELRGKCRSWAKHLTIWILWSVYLCCHPDLRDALSAPSQDQSQGQIPEHKDHLVSSFLALHELRATGPEQHRSTSQVVRAMLGSFFLSILLYFFHHSSLLVPHPVIFEDFNFFRFNQIFEVLTSLPKGEYIKVHSFYYLHILLVSLCFVKFHWLPMQKNVKGETASTKFCD